MCALCHFQQRCECRAGRAAQIGKERGATVIAITSETYSKQAAKGVRLAEVADIVLDNGAPSGDATVAVPGSDLKVGPISTSIGAALLNAVMAAAAAAASGRCRSADLSERQHAGGGGKQCRADQALPAQKSHIFRAFRARNRGQQGAQ
jgi:hypothetical protein